MTDSRLSASGPVCSTCVQLGCGDGLPAEVTEELLGDDGFMQKFHHALLEVRCGSVSVVGGARVCLCWVGGVGEGGGGGKRSVPKGV